MLKMKNLFIILLIVMVSIINIPLRSYAEWVTVTDENLNTALQKLKNSEDNIFEIDNVSVADNIIAITKNGKKYNLKYDLTGNPIITSEIDIKKGMSYDDFEKVITFGALGTATIVYFAIADIQGVKYEDIFVYFLANSLSGEFSFSSNDYPVIYDDTDGEVTLTNPTDKDILKSQFGDKVVEVADKYYFKEKRQEFSDSSEGCINSYKMVTEKKEVTDDYLKIVTTLTINKDADFSKITDVAKNFSGAIEDMFNNTPNDSNQTTPDETKDTSSIQQQSPTTNSSDRYTPNVDTSKIKEVYTSSKENTKKNDENNNDTETIANKTLPKTGTYKAIVISIISISILVAIVFGIKNKEYKCIK